VYDPSTRGFLSTDPLSPVVGAGWDGNPYAFAGNNPIGLSDPTGLRPATDADLKAYGEAHQGLKGFAADNWEYAVGGLMVVGSGVLIATGVGGPVGAMVAGASSGGIGGAAQGAYGYFTGPGPHDVMGALRATATGTVMGAATGVAGGVLGSYAARGLMRPLTEGAESSTVAMGRWMEGRVIPYAEHHGYYKGTPTWIHNPMDALAKKAVDVPVVGGALQSATETVDKAFNRAWINTQVNARLTFP